MYYKGVKDMSISLIEQAPSSETENPIVGRVVVDVEITNNDDEANLRSGFIKPDKVRRAVVPMLVDTGATTMTLPEELIKKLGLTVIKEVTSRFANGQSSIRKIYGAVHLSIMGRDTVSYTLASPPGVPALLGQIPLEGLDLMVDSKRQKLVPGHPESPDMQMYEEYGTYIPS